jgi:hypothetical protein
VGGDRVRAVGQRVDPLPGSHGRHFGSDRVGGGDSRVVGAAWPA